jgi:perosamine synthetase
MIVTNNEHYYKRGMSCRGHGICRDFKEREKINSHYYEMNMLGFNYRIPDVLCALGISQMDKLDKFIQRRNEIAKKYDHFFEQYKDIIQPLKNNYENAYHIYVVKLNTEKIEKSRDDIFRELKKSGIGVNVHYMPIYLHPYYQKLGYQKGLCPESEKIYEQMITLPIFPLLEDEEVEIVFEKMMNIILNEIN